MRKQFAAVLVAVMLVTAGCSSGGTGPGDSGEPSDGTSGDAVGTIEFYISDQPGAIEDFERLNVTISQVEFRKADGDEGTEDGDGENATTDGNDGGWQRFDVDDRTVDLTRLKGDNATLLEEFEVENGTYTGVRVSVSEINGTLTDGSSADVKLPSEELRINQRLVVGNDESVDFVYDITVVKRGNSGSYNIQPVAGESGTDVPIDRVDDGSESDDMESEDGDAAAGNETTTEVPALEVEFVGNVTAGENATVSVTRNGTVVENATVSYSGTDYTTDADGTVTFEVPSDAEAVEVEVTDGEGAVTLTESLDSEGSADGGQAADSGGGSEDTSTGTATATAAD